MAVFGTGDHTAGGRCTIRRQTEPQRTATEEMQISVGGTTTFVRTKVASDIDLDTVRDDVRSLKGDFETFLHDLKSGTFDGIAEATGRRADEVVKHIRKRPLSSILIAFGVGIVSSRFLLR